MKWVLYVVTVWSVLVIANKISMEDTLKSVEQNM